MMAGLTRAVDGLGEGVKGLLEEVRAVRDALQPGSREYELMVNVQVGLLGLRMRCLDLRARVGAGGIAEAEEEEGTRGRVPGRGKMEAAGERTGTGSYG